MSFSVTSSQTKGPLGWWYRIGAPPNVSNDAPLKERERVRIGKITSLALFIELIEMGIAGGSIAEDPNKVLPFGYLGIVIALFIALLFNRRGNTTVAGIISVVMIEFAMVLTILGIPNQTLDAFNLPLLELFIQPLLIAASLFPVWMVFPLAIYHIVCICLTLTFLPKTSELITHIQHTPYTAYGIPITLQVVTALISFIWVRSAYNELHRAETAQEVNRLTREIADHLMVSAERQKELERNIEVIRIALASVSGGNYLQRIPLTEQDMLWQVALSLNNLLSRTHNFQEQALRFAQVNEFLARLANELRLYRTGQKNIQIPQLSTGTALDLLAVELNAWIVPSSSFVAQQTFPASPRRQSLT